MGERRVIIAGGRDFTDAQLLNDKVTWLWKGTDFGRTWTIVCGMASGADMLGWHWAMDHEQGIKEFPADWIRYGKAAGPKRNAQMAKFAAENPGGMLIAFWDGLSPGTRNMIQEALFHGLEVHVFRYSSK